MGIDPERCSYEEWAANYAQALWLEQWRLKNEAGMIAAELPEGEKDRYSHRGKAARLMRMLIEKEAGR